MYYVFHVLFTNDTQCPIKMVTKNLTQEGLCATGDRRRGGHEHLARELPEC